MSTTAAGEPPPDLGGDDGGDRTATSPSQPEQANTAAADAVVAVDDDSATETEDEDDEPASVVRNRKIKASASNTDAAARPCIAIGNDDETSHSSKADKTILTSNHCSTRTCHPSDHSVSGGGTNTSAALSAPFDTEMMVFNGGSGEIGRQVIAASSSSLPAAAAVDVPPDANNDAIATKPSVSSISNSDAMAIHTSCAIQGRCAIKSNTGKDVTKKYTLGDELDKGGANGDKWQSVSLPSLEQQLQQTGGNKGDGGVDADDSTGIKGACKGDCGDKSIGSSKDDDTDAAGKGDAGLVTAETAVNDGREQNNISAHQVETISTSTSSTPVAAKAVASAKKKKKKQNSPTMNAVLRNRKAGSDHDNEAIDSCANFIESYLMTKTCTNRMCTLPTKCTCMKTLDPALVRPVASYVAVTWHNKSNDEKVNQIGQWIQNKGDDGLPFLLPTVQEEGSQRLQPRKICRNALMEVVGISSAMWRKAEKAESALRGASAAVEIAANGASGEEGKISCDNDANGGVRDVDISTLVLANVNGSKKNSVASSVLDNQKAAALAVSMDANDQDMTIKHPPSSENGTVVSVSKGSTVPTEDCSSTRRSGVSGKMQPTNVAIATSSQDHPQQKAVDPSKGEEKSDHITNKWVCNVCNTAAFDDFGAACRHEERCKPAGASGPANAGEGDDAEARVHPVASLVEQQQEPATRPDGNIDIAAAYTAVGAPAEDKHLVYVCDVCNIAEFDDFDEACRHEEACKGVAPAVTAAKSTETKAEDGNDGINGAKSESCALPEAAAKASSSAAAISSSHHRPKLPNNSAATPGTNKDDEPIKPTVCDGAASAAVTLKEIAEGKYSANNNDDKKSGDDCVEPTLPKPYSTVAISGISSADYVATAAPVIAKRPSLMDLEASRVVAVEAAGTSALLAVSRPTSTSPKPDEQAAKSASPTVSAPSMKPKADEHPAKKPNTKSSFRFCIGQDVWVKSGVDLSSEHSAKVVSTGAFDASEITIRWADANYDEKVPISKVRSMYMAIESNRRSVEQEIDHADDSFKRVNPAAVQSNASRASLHSQEVATVVGVMKPSGTRRSDPRPLSKYQCGRCDACMIDDCGECKYCLDMPRFGGSRKMRKNCLNRPKCTVRGSEVMVQVPKGDDLPATPSNKYSVEGCAKFRQSSGGMCRAHSKVTQKEDEKTSDVGLGLPESKWRCHRCKRENDLEKKSCSGCNAWKDGRRVGYSPSPCAPKATVEHSTESKWRCHLCDRENDAEKKRCSGCKAWKGGKRVGYSPSQSMAKAHQLTTNAMAEHSKKGAAADIKGGAIPRRKFLDELVARTERNQAAIGREDAADTRSQLQYENLGSHFRADMPFHQVKQKLFEEGWAEIVVDGSNGNADDDDALRITVRSSYAHITDPVAILKSTHRYFDHFCSDNELKIFLRTRLGWTGPPSEQHQFEQSEADQPRTMNPRSSATPPSISAPTNASTGTRRSEHRRPSQNQCGRCDACMIDDCGECKHCLDMPQFGGNYTSKRPCLNRPKCTVRGSAVPKGGAAAVSSVTVERVHRAQCVQCDEWREVSGDAKVDEATFLCKDIGETCISATPAIGTPTNASIGLRRSKPRPPNHSQCGSCDACMIDDCGKCPQCLDMPRFGGSGKMKQKCLNRPECTAKLSRVPKRSAPTKRKSSAEAEYVPPEVNVGEKIMKYFSDAYYEGTVERLPTKGSPYYFIIYEDGDKEEIDEDDFWAAYSDWRVQKDVLRPSEFVPESRVVANDGRVAVVRTFRPVFKGKDSTWSYLVHFSGWSAPYDKWMPEVDLRKETPATLRWAARVREAQSKGKGKSKAKTPRPETQPQTTPTERSKLSTPAKGGKRVVKDTSSVGDKQGQTKKRAYPSRHAIVGTCASRSDSSPAAKRAKTTNTASSSASSSGGKRRTRRMVMEEEVSKAQKKGPKPKRLKRGKAAKIGNGNNSEEDDEGSKKDILPSIEVGTSILKYFSEGRSYFEGRVTKLPTKGKGQQFYHVVYEDGDEEDMEPNDLWIAFSDWCVANAEISLTKFEPGQNVFASDRSGYLDAVIQAFRPILKRTSKPDAWTWSYLIHFTRWNRRHDRWVDEDELMKVTPSTTKWAEQTRKEAQESKSQKTSDAFTTPSRRRERDDDTSTGSPTRKYRWRCHRCDRLNDPDHTKCSECQGWKGGKMPKRDDRPATTNLCSVDGCGKSKRSGCNEMCRSHFNEAQQEDEDSSDSDISTSSAKWHCHLCKRRNDPDELRCSACNVWRQCFVAGCTKRRQKDCEGMCAAHFREAEEANESSDSDNDSEPEEANGKIKSPSSESSTRNQKCSVEGCTRFQQSSCNGMCCTHFREANDSSDSEPEEANGQMKSPSTKADATYATGREDAATRTNTATCSSSLAAASSARLGATKEDRSTEEKSEKTDVGGGDNSEKSEANMADRPIIRPIHAGQAPNLQSVLNLLQDSDDEKEDDVFGYFGLLD